jgi:hypothetical protein
MEASTRRERALAYAFSQQVKKLVHDFSKLIKIHNRNRKVLVKVVFLVIFTVRNYDVTCGLSTLILHQGQHTRDYLPMKNLGLSRINLYVISPWTFIFIDDVFY